MAIDERIEREYYGKSCLSVYINVYWLFLSFVNLLYKTVETRSSYETSLGIDILTVVINAKISREEKSLIAKSKLNK